MKFAVGERNVEIMYSFCFCIWLCNMNAIITSANDNRYFVTSDRHENEKNVAVT